MQTYTCIYIYIYIHTINICMDNTCTCMVQLSYCCGLAADTSWSTVSFHNFKLPLLLTNRSLTHCNRTDFRHAGQDLRYQT